MLPTVILFGNEKDKSITKPLFRTLSDRYRVTLLEKNRILTKGGGAPVLLIDTPELTLRQNECCLVLLKRHRNLKRLCVPPHTTTVFSVEKPLPKKLIGLCPQGIACGGHEGSLSFSSITPERSMISLQRRMTDCFGSVIEPMEIAVKTDRADPYAVLASVAAALWLHQPEPRFNFSADKS